MRVVSDTTPINYLILTDHIEVLPHLFGRVAIPEAVQRELMDPRGPIAVRQWIASPPDWLDVRKAPPYVDHPGVDRGEAEAIALAKSMDTLLLVDDRKGRKAAMAEGVLVTRTVNVIGRAASSGLLNYESALRDLQTTSFYISERLMNSLLQRHSQEQQLLAQEVSEHEPDLDPDGGIDL